MEDEDTFLGRARDWIADGDGPATIILAGMIGGLLAAVMKWGMFL